MKDTNYKPQKESQMTVNEAAAVYGQLEEENIYSIIQLVKEGIRFHVFKLIMEKSPFSISDWSNFLHLSERTMLRYKNENKSFDPIYSEKIMEISLLQNYGKKVFGSEENFNVWLHTTNIALGGITPKDLLDNSFGIRLLKDELTRIAHGILA
ncbi:MAG TPA: MbcA/ParS/Xre antitoxin family protein [Arachidicoccus soli]|nr:MbcA/ParS/Xre antitoxin family protein [Arachidicoccus soli]